MSTGNAATLTGSRLPLKVLLIEDSAVIRESLSEALGSTGMLEVTGVAETADDAVRTLENDSFDAVIVDIQLRRGSGMDVLSYLHERGLLEKLMAIVLTNYALATYRKRCQQLGVQHFFDKSLEFDRVIEVLDEFATGRQA
ncbi:response regulator [Pandoraea anhela]|uniref:Chemotaxis protein CheY n=1 Tax=Pandoraea anhela TaxID=2508295 RepID=A0A5E4VAT6_9BURK|nr:response regulator [Pandoraea anhela]VVE08050.1 chemotaxis protein CheY [Pandoraea anhela]